MSTTLSTSPQPIVAPPLAPRAAERPRAPAVLAADRRRARIVAVLAEHAFPVRSVRVIVIGRHAILWGVVRDRISAVLAEDLALAVDGIERCDNRLLTGARQPVTTPRHDVVGD